MATPCGRRRRGRPCPVSQRIPAGSVPAPLDAGTAARIFTGAPVPPGADAVVMQEQAEPQADGSVVFTAPVSAGQNIRRRGEDIADGQTVLAAGQRLRDADLGLAASIGAATLSVHARLRVAVFFTGDELLEPGQPAAPGKIYNSNRYWLVPALQALGCEVLDLGIIADNLAATRQALREAAAVADVVMTCGGVSVGEEDHVKAAVEAEGELQLWKIAIKPGKAAGQRPYRRRRFHRPARQPGVRLCHLCGAGARLPACTPGRGGARVAAAVLAAGRF